jgi:hypothetical protein
MFLFDCSNGFSVFQCSPWHSPRVLSPVDLRGRGKYRSIENLTSPFLSGRPLFPSRRSAQGRPPSESDTTASDGATTNEQDSSDCDSLKVSDAGDGDVGGGEELRLPDFATTGNGVLTPHEAKALTVTLRSGDVGLVQRSLVTISNCAAFTMNQASLLLAQSNNCI